MGKKSKGFSAIHKKLKPVHFSATQIIALVFAGIILVGALLLMLPVASVNGSVSFLDALFTATSATCVTGLTVGDTGTMWTPFGQAVIITLIEVGGLGFMSVVSMMIFLFRRRIGMRQRMVIAQALSLEDMESVVKIQKLVIGGSLGIQALGALVLTVHYWPEFGLGTALKYGLFHSISGFCNAGFDIFGNGDSLVSVNTDPVLLITLMVLVVVSGLGFLVWDELVRVRRFKNFSVYTKLVLVTTAVLILGGAAITLALEWNNPDTLGNMSWGNKILNSFFQSVTLRTAGFAALDQGKLTDGSKAISVVLMLIGGSSGSTAGGLKTVTFMVLVLFIISRIRGRSSVNVFCRRVPNHKILDAMTIASILVGLAVAGAIVICVSSPVSFTDSIFEAASALGTVGLTAGATPLLSVPARIMIIVFMYFGRVGVLTLSMGFLLDDKVQQRFRYAETNLMIG